MVQDIETAVIISLVSLIIGFLLNETKSYLTKWRDLNSKREIWAIILQKEAKGIVDIINQYIHDCHLPHYGTEKEIFCRAKKISERGILSISMKSFQNISEYVELFDEDTIELIFYIRWGLSDIINTCNDISRNFNIKYIEDLDELPDEERDHYQTEVEDMVHSFEKDEKFVADTCCKLIDNLKGKYPLRISLSD